MAQYGRAARRLVCSAGQRPSAGVRPRPGAGRVDGPHPACGSLWRGPAQSGLGQHERAAASTAQTRDTASVRDPAMARAAAAARACVQHGSGADTVPRWALPATTRSGARPQHGRDRRGASPVCGSFSAGSGHVTA
ncbi:hypothetical protein Zm00014a_015403 [Zea mays]|uniref:Uncharacterized protein n=1 Tax=Zea mays TaxID=4577 RepID=A0A3L6D8U9_MAIZE|nr:hypothetical protein Zm00014a_015403 [Zea mays]